jgi:hypothetical protein
MFNQVYHTPGWSNKIKVLAYKPGWRPQELGGYQSAPEIDHKNYSKFNLHPTPQLAYYVLSQFAILLGVTTYFLFQINEFELLNKLYISGFLIWSVAQLGLLLEDKRAYLWAELPRALAFITGIIYFQIISPINYIAIFLTTISILYIFWIKTWGKLPHSN